MTLTPYLNLPGNAEEVINFYKDIFGGTTEIMRWSEMPPDPNMPMDENWQNKIMHCSLIINKDITIYLSDSLVEGTPINNTVFLHVVFDTEDKLRNAFDSLSANGRVNMPVENTFWGSIYGNLVDRFGTGWGLEFPLPK